MGKHKVTVKESNDDFELPDRSCLVSHMQDYIAYIIKEHETLTTNPPINIYMNRINDKRSKDRYKLKL